MDSRENLLFRCMKYLKELKEFEDGFQEVLDRAPCGYDLHGRSFVDMSLVKLMMELLEKLYLDYERWINYWVYDLDFGRNWKPGELIDSDGSDIKLQTVEDLEAFLQKKLLYRSRQSLQEIEEKEKNDR